MLAYTTIQHAFRKAHGLTMNEYTLCDMIYHLSVNPDSKIKGWCYMSKQKMADEIGISKRSIEMTINRMIEIQLIEKDEETAYLKTTSKWNQVYFTSQSSAHPAQNLRTDSAKSAHDDSAKSAHNNIYSNNNTDNKSTPPLFEVPKREAPQPPEWLEFLSYAKTHSPNVNIEHLHLKFEAWRAGGWKITQQNGKERPIKNWKSTLLQTLPYIKQDQPTQTKKQYY